MPCCSAGTGATKITPFLYRLYDGLTRNDPVAPADVIVVLAGLMERKPYGLELYHSGVAPRLLLSVGRFEVRRMPSVGFADAARLIAERDRTAPGDRHFFCDITAEGTRIQKANLGRWNTYGELVGLRQYLGDDLPRRAMIVSTDVHLRRVALTFHRVFRGAPIEARFCAVPAGITSVTREEWWRRPDDRRFVLSELKKLAGYGSVMWMPQAIVQRTIGRGQTRG